MTGTGASLRRRQPRRPAPAQEARHEREKDEPALRFIQGRVEHRRHVQRDELREGQAAHHRHAQRPT